MPIFEYKCSECHKSFELLENSSGRRNSACPHCGSRKLKKQFSTFSVGVKQGASARCDTCSDGTCPHAGAGH